MVTQYVDFMCSSLISTIFETHKGKITSDNFVITLEDYDNVKTKEIKVKKDSLKDNLSNIFTNINDLSENKIKNVIIYCVDCNSKMTEITSIAIN